MEKPIKIATSQTVQVNEKSQEVFMSFALLNRLCFLIGDMDSLPRAMQDPVLREALLKEMLTERSKTGRIKGEGLVELEDLDVPLEDMQVLLDWASEHVLDFTLAGLEKSGALQFRHQARLLNLKSLLTGSPS